MAVASVGLPQQTMQTDLSLVAVLLEGLDISTHVKKVTRKMSLSSKSSMSDDRISSGNLSPTADHKRRIIPEMLVLSSDESVPTPDKLSPESMMLIRRNMTLSPTSPLSPSRKEIDLKSGSIGLLEFDVNGHETTTRVFVKVFGNNYEQHAQIYTDTSFSNLLGYISLRNCDITLDTVDTKMIHITLNNVVDETGRASTVKLRADTETDAIDWVNALTPQITLPVESDCSPRGSPMLPRHFLCTTCK